MLLHVADINSFVHINNMYRVYHNIIILYWPAVAIGVRP